jgi:2-dehydropantoate 2-reductase
MKPLSIAIVGSGAIGSYYGARLAVAGHDVKFLLKSDYQQAQEHGITIRSIHGDLLLKPVNAFLSTEEMGVVDLVIVAWKTTSNHLSKAIISPLLGAHSKILTLQNGLGNVELLGQLFGIERILGGLCFVCLNRLRPAVISHTASGLIRIAWANQPIDAFLQQLVSSFNDASIPCEGVNNLEKALWMKLVWNFPFNGLAISEGGVDTHVLLKERNLELLIREIMHEVIGVGRMLGHDIPDSLIDQQIEITKEMGPYKPSSMIDYVEGKAIELDAIWLNPLKVAETLGAKVPQMQALSKKITTLMHSKKTVDF